MAYQWASVYQWLEYKTHEWFKEQTREELRELFVVLTREVEAEDLQDIFQSDMDEDGYFEGNKDV